MRILVLMGGTSSERDVSLASGLRIAAALRARGHSVEAMDTVRGRLTPAEVSGIASAIDVPVYVLGLVPAIDNPSADISATTYERSALTGPLSDLATWTGGRAFVASTALERSQAARQIVDELRQQYLIAFESSGTPDRKSVV